MCTSFGWLVNSCIAKMLQWSQGIPILTKGRLQQKLELARITKLCLSTSLIYFSKNCDNVATSVMLVSWIHAPLPQLEQADELHYSEATFLHQPNTLQVTLKATPHSDNTAQTSKRVSHFSPRLPVVVLNTRHSEGAVINQLAIWGMD